MIAANWKMNGVRAHSRSLAKEIITFAAKYKEQGWRIVLFPPATLLHSLNDICNDEMLGAQDCHHELEGAYTGSVSASQLRDGGAGFVLIGHSECRARGDDDALIGLKLDTALKAGLKPILCVGESLAIRDRGEAVDFVKKQICSMPLPYAIAYEPLWAIGTGHIPDKKDIEQMHKAIGQSGIKRILYGGSVNGENAASLASIEGVGGLLVGGASLNAADFITILKEVSSSLAMRERNR